MKKIIDVVFHYKNTPFFLLLLCTIAYGIFIPWLGSYSDDLSFLYYYRTLGAEGLRDLLENERPMQGFVYSITIPLLGTSPMVWQIAALLTHWLSAVGVWFLLGKLWPNENRQNAWVASLYAVFPGFIDHWMALTWSHLFLMNAVAFTSLGLMLCSFKAKKGKGWLIAASMLTGALNLIYSEYSYGLEFSRFFIIYLFIVQTEMDKNKRVTWALKKYWPYLVLLIAVLIWRFWIFESGKYNLNLSEVYGESAWMILWGMIKETAVGFFRAAFQVWGKVADVFKIGFQGVSNLFIWLIILVMMAVSFIFFFTAERFFRKKKMGDQPLQSNWWIQAIFLGSLCLALSIIPFIAAGNKISLDLPEKRFMISFALPSSLIFIGFLDAFHKYLRTAGLVLFIVVLGLSIGRQVDNANSYRKAFLLQQRLFWQLSWRIPQLEPGTLLVTQVMDIPYYSENHLTATLNRLYAPALQSRSEPYAFAYTNGRIRDLFVKYKPDQPINLCDREDLCFSGNTSNIITFYYSQTGCLTILDAELAPISVALADYRQQLQDVVPYSQLSRIMTETELVASPTISEFGKEPDHDWCYYFEKADLARQMGEWRTVVDTWNQAHRKGFFPLQITENFLFIDGFAHVGEWQLALDLSRTLYSSDPLLHTGLCDIWTRIANEKLDPAGAGYSMDKILQEFNCAY